MARKGQSFNYQSRGGSGYGGRKWTTSAKGYVVAGAKDSNYPDTFKATIDLGGNQKLLISFNPNKVFSAKKDGTRIMYLNVLKGYFN